MIPRDPTEPGDTPDTVLRRSRDWLERAVIGLNLCPFARAVHVRGRIHWRVSSASTPEALRVDLVDALQQLAVADPQAIDTTLLVHPNVLGDFLDFNDFLDTAEAALVQLGLEGVLQIAPFHPQFQFAGSAPEDITNFTNRSPYPTLHLLREASVEAAVQGLVDAGSDAASIYERNQATLEDLGHAGWRRLLGPAAD